MSRLDNGPDEVLVYVEVDGTDDDGNPVKVPAATPMKVRGDLQPSTAEEATALGQSLTTLYRFIARDFPGGAFARVSARGRDWDVIGEPKRRNSSDATRHVTVWLSARTPEVL